MNSSIDNLKRDVAKLETDLKKGRIGRIRFGANTLYAMVKTWVNLWYNDVRSRDPIEIGLNILVAPMWVISLFIIGLVTGFEIIETIISNTFKIIKKR